MGFLDRNRGPQQGQGQPQQPPAWPGGQGQQPPQWPGMPGQGDPGQAPQWPGMPAQGQPGQAPQWPGMPAQGAGGRQSLGDMIAMAQQMQAAAMQQTAAMQEATAGTTVGTMTWARAVMSLIAPAPPGFVKRCTCANCTAPKKAPSQTAYVYCDYCASLMDYDLRRAGEGDTPPGPEYANLVNGLQPSLKAAQAAGDRDGYRGMQRQIYEAYVTNVPMAVSHRARNDETYRRRLVEYMAEAAVVRAFDPTCVQLEEEMRQRVIGLRYSGSMMAQKVDTATFWPMTETLTRQIEVTRALNRSTGVTDLDPDRAEHMTGKMAWSGFCQGWLPLLPDDAAAQLLQRAGLTNEYVAVQVEDGQPRRCGACGGPVTALPGAQAVVCDGCGRTLDIGAAEIPCANCQATMTLPRGADRTTCPFCGVGVEKVGIL